MSRIPKDLRRLLDAEAPGTRVETTTKSHLRLLVPGGGIVICAGTPSDHRHLMNLRAGVRRALRQAVDRQK